MQVFICDMSMEKFAAILDDKRLNKQIVEAFQIVEDRLPTLNHPAYLFWKNHKPELRMYMTFLCEEYTKRFGREHKCSSVCLSPETKDFSFIRDFDIVFLSMKVNLLRKNYDWYSKFFCVNKSVDDYPDGYYWSIPYGKSSRKSTEDWCIIKDV